MTSDTKEKRLRLLAKRAGDLSVAAYHGGNRDKAYFFLRKMNAILKMIQNFDNGVRHRSKGANDVGDAAASLDHASVPPLR